MRNGLNIGCVMREKREGKKLMRIALLALSICIMFGKPLQGATPAGYSQFFVPGDEENLWNIMATLGGFDDTQKAQGMHSIISVVASSDNTIVYYDHWEDGYDFDPASPSTADEYFTISSRGGVWELESSNIKLAGVSPATPRCTDNPPVDCYDGRDKIYVAGGVPTVTRTSWTEAVGTIQALSWEVYPVKPQLTTYKVPFGEDLDTAKDYRDFERVYTLIMATEDGTTVTIDLNNDGVIDSIDADHDGTVDGTSLSLNAGEVYLLDNSSITLADLNLTYDFESGPSGFYTGTASGQTNWEYGTPTVFSSDSSPICSSSNCSGGGPDVCSSGSSCWATDLDDLYDNNINGVYLYSPVYNFSGYDTVQISYREWLEVEGNNYDFARLQYSIDGGAWQDDWVYGAGDPTREDLNWVDSPVHNATSYAAGQSVVQWRWVIETDFTWQWGGWYIDDVNISATASAGTFSDVLTGGEIKGSDTLQVQYVVGDQGATYELRGLSAFPRGFWDDEYYAPVDGANVSGAPVDIYVHNPHSVDLIINWETSANSGSFTVNPGDTLSFSDGTGGYVPPGSAVYLSGSDVFWGVSTIDAGQQTNDWGYSLVPALLLENEHYMGWAPGSTSVSTSPDDSGIFITAVQDNTRVYVDRDPEDGSDPILEYTLNRLENQYVFDALDGDLTGAHVRATGPIVMSYGQNPETAATASPAIDVGYTTIPGGNLLDRVFTVDKTADPAILPVTAREAPTTFTIIVNSYDYSINDVNVVDTLPDHYQYLPGTTKITRGDYSSVTDGAADPVQIGAELSWSATVLGGLAPHQSIIIQFDAQTTRDFGIGDISINNVDSTGTRTVEGITQIFSASDFAVVTYGSLQVGKTSTGVDPLVPGDQYSYSVTVTNPATETQPITGVAIYDPLPPGISYLAGTASVQITPPSNARDEFETVSYANNDGSYLFAADWVEEDEAGSNGEIDGNVRVTGGQLRMTVEGSVVTRQLDTSSMIGDLNFTFDYATSSGVDTSDRVRIFVSADGTNFQRLQTITNISGVSTGSGIHDITAYKSATTYIRFTIDRYYGGTNEYFYVDNVDITAGPPAGGIAANPPPGFVSGGDGYSLAPGQTLTLTYDVQVDDPLATGIDTIINTAYVSADQFPQPIQQSVTNIVNNPSLESGAVTGRVWYDLDGDTIEDLGETGFANVTVALKDEYGATAATTVTNSGGNYSFTGVTPATGYYIEVLAGIPAGFIQTAPADQGGRSNTFAVVAGGVVSDIDIGYNSPPGSAALGDTVWHDVDDDGVQDPGEIGLALVPVTLYADRDNDGILEIGGDDGASVATTTTDSSGNYLFSDIDVSTYSDYFVVVTPIPGYTIDPGEGELLATSLSGGDRRLDYDFGLEATATTYTLKEKIFLDSNSDGYTSGDLGIAGITVDLLNGSGFVISSAISDINGDVEFVGLAGDDADYTLRITDNNGILTNYYGTTAAAIAGEVDYINFDADDESESFGYFLDRTLGGTVFRDLDSSTGQNGVEPGISGVTVLLYVDVDDDGIYEPGADDGASVGSVITDVNGDFFFAGISYGKYFVVVDENQPQLAGLGLTTADQNGESGPGHVLSYDFNSGTNYLDLDFGYHAGDDLSIAGYVWEDTLEVYGEVGAGENRFANVSVELRNNDGTLLIDTKFTDSNGYYEFPGLPEGTYSIYITDTANVLNDMRTVYEVTEGLDFENGLLYDSKEVVQVTTSSGSAMAINFGYEKFEPTHALIGSLQVFSKDGFNVVQWQTSSEIGTRGFDLLRLGEDKTPVIVNNSLIPSVFTSLQGIYQCSDPAMSPGENMYMIREYEVHGGVRDYGPFNVVLGENSAETFTLISGIKEKGYALQPIEVVKKKTGNVEIPAAMLARMAPAAQMMSMSDLPFSGNLILKVGVTNGGVYTMTIGTMAASTGLSTETITDLVQAGKLSITNKGRQVKYIVDGLDSSIYFYGARHSTLYSDENVYFFEFNRQGASGDINEDGVVSIRDAIESLQILAGAETSSLADFNGSADINGNSRLDMAEVINILSGVDTSDTQLMETVSGGNPVAEVGVEQSFSESLHFENDVIAKPDMPVGSEKDYWFWKHFNSIVTTETVPFTIVDNLDAITEARLVVNLYGLSDDNSAELKLNVGHANEIDLGTVTWSGFTIKRVVVTLDNNELITGENNLQIDRTAAGDNIFALDSIDVRYAREFIAVNDIAMFNNGNISEITVSGFSASDILVMDVTEDAEPKLVTETLITEDGGVYSVTFTTHGDKHEYAAFIIDGLSEPATVKLDSSDTDLLANDEGAPYIIITPEDFASVAQILADFRTANGLDAKVILLSDIFDSFSHGLYDPRAIQQFIRYASNNWYVPPRYIVLAGDGTFDYKDNQGFGDNFIPAMMAETPYGLFTADGLYTDIDNDGMPNIPIGRIPAGNSGELAVMIGKIIEYETGTGSATVVLVADEDDETVGNSFSVGSEQYAAQVGSDFAVEKIYVSGDASPAPPYYTSSGAHAALVDSINAGPMLLNYIGHGAWENIGISPILENADTSSLYNSRYPVFAAQTCLVGDYAYPGFDSLGEAMFKKIGGGFVAAWSPSGLSDNAESVKINKVFIEKVFSQPGVRLGDAIQQALSDYHGSDYTEYMLHIFNLMGDPALKLQE